MSLLFPIEKLADRFVEAALPRTLRKEARLTAQAPFTFAAGMTLWVLPFEAGQQAGAEHLIIRATVQLAEVIRPDAESLPGADAPASFRLSSLV